MARREYLFKLAPRLQELKIGVILIQIQEAHSTLWKIGLDYCPEPQKTYEERVKRANEFVKKYDCPYPVYIDGWDDNFEQNYRAWPDKYYYVDVKTCKVLQKSEYDKEGEKDGLIKDDYASLLGRLCNQ